MNVSWIMFAVLVPAQFFAMPAYYSTIVGTILYCVIALCFVLNGFAFTVMAAVFSRIKNITVTKVTNNRAKPFGPIEMIIGLCNLIMMVQQGWIVAAWLFVINVLVLRAGALLLRRTIINRL